MTCRGFVRATVLLLLVLTAATGALFAAAPTPMFRVFLKDGTPLVCWGEYARVGDRLVLTVPIGTGSRTTYEFVSIPVSRVDLPKTERYAEAVRAAQFAATRGKAEYSELSDRLAAQLASIAAMPDPKERLAIAENARQQLMEWAETSHGYRAKEVSQLLQMFDSAIIDLRVAAGESRFAINLSGGLMPQAPMQLRAAPTARETVDLALKAAAVADSDDVKRALLKRARAAAAALPKGDPRTAKLKVAVDRELAAAVRVEANYRRLDHDVRGLLESAVDRGDVLAVDALRERVLRTDRLLGRQRPEDIRGLLEVIDRKKDAAAEQRLVLDHWQTLQGELRDYQKSTSTLIRTLDGLAGTLNAIRQMAGPPVTILVTAERQTASVVAQFRDLFAPEGASAAHSLLGLAIEQADLAVRTRHRAVDARELSMANDASEAAADSRTRLVQAKEAIAKAMKPPKAIR